VVVPDLPLRFDLMVVEPGDRLRHHRTGSDRRPLPAPLAATALDRGSGPIGTSW
jgi:hypothetical protein